MIGPAAQPTGVVPLAVTRGSTSAEERLIRLAEQVEQDDVGGQGALTARIIRARLTLAASDPRRAAAGAAAIAARWRQELPGEPITAVYCEVELLCEQAERERWSLPTLEITS